MTTPLKTVSNARIARLKLLFGSAVIFASLAAAGQAASPYPQLTAPAPAQSSSIVRPCTQLEIAAELLPSDCGTLTLSDVVGRMHDLQSNNRDD